jgi:hypothetical protein
MADLRGKLAWLISWMHTNFWTSVHCFDYQGGRQQRKGKRQKQRERDEGESSSRQKHARAKWGLQNGGVDSERKTEKERVRIRERRK